MLCLEKPHVGQALRRKGVFRHAFTVVASRRVQAWGSSSSQSWWARGPVHLLGSEEGSTQETQRGEGTPEQRQQGSHNLDHAHPIFLHSSVNGHLRCFLICPCMWVQSLSRVRLFVTLQTVAARPPVHRIFQARILELVAISSSKGSS